MSGSLVSGLGVYCSGSIIINYRPQRSCGQGNIFALFVILFTGGGVSALVHTGIPHPLGADPPPEQTPPTPPPLGSRLRHTVNERPVRILLECILVQLCWAYKHIGYWGLLGYSRISSGSSGRVGGEKHEIYAAAFDSHLFYDLFLQGRGGARPCPSPTPDPPPRTKTASVTSEWGPPTVN